MYEGDSFFTLSWAGRLGLVGLSTLLAAVLIAAPQAARRRSGSAAVGVTTGLLAFWLFLWLSPQVYYGYYRTLFQGLSAQLVVKDPPGPAQLFSTLTFRAKPTLAAHGAGALGWALVAAGALRLGPGARV